MSCYGKIMVGIEFSLSSCELVGELLVELMFNWVSEHNMYWLMNWLWIGMWMCVFISLGSQTLEGDRGKQPETSNKWMRQSL